MKRVRKVDEERDGKTERGRWRERRKERDREILKREHTTFSGKMKFTFQADVYTLE